MRLSHKPQLGPQDEETVYFFMTEHEPLSNWSAHMVKVWGIKFPTAEHAFQYKKFANVDPDWAETIRSATSPWLAKRFSRQRIIVAKKWDSIRLQVMEEILRAKLEQHEDVKNALLKTEPKAIVEASAEGDFWGYGRDGTGQNRLGKLWIKLRQEIITSNQNS